MDRVTVHSPLMSVATYASTGVPSGDFVPMVIRTDLAARVAARALFTTSGPVSRANGAVSCCWANTGLQAVRARAVTAQSVAVAVRRAVAAMWARRRMVGF